MTIKIGQESLSNTKAVGNFSYIFCIFKLYLIVDIVLGFSKWKCKIKKDNGIWFRTQNYFIFSPTTQKCYSLFDSAHIKCNRHRFNCGANK